MAGVETTRISGRVLWPFLPGTARCLLHIGQNAHLAEQADGDTSAKELAHVLGGELAEDVEDMLLDLGGLSLGIVGTVGNSSGGEVGVVYGVVDGDRDFEGSAVVDHSSCDTCPHGLVRGIGDG